MATTYVRNQQTGEFELVGPGGATTDTTLSQLGKPADAAAVGSAISSLNASKAASDHTHNYAGASQSGGAATSADKLTISRTIRTNLGSTSTASFDGTADVTPGITGTLPVANGGTGQTKAWTNGTVTSVNNTTVSSAQFAIFPYLNKAFIRLNILTPRAIGADDAEFIALPSKISTAHTALACYNEIGYDIHCGISSVAGKGVYIMNCGTSSMPINTRLYISGWYSI